MENNFGHSVLDSEWLIHFSHFNDKRLQKISIIASRHSEDKKLFDMTWRIVFFYSNYDLNNATSI